MGKGQQFRAGANAYRPSTPLTYCFTGTLHLDSHYASSTFSFPHSDLTGHTNYCAGQHRLLGLAGVVGHLVGTAAIGWLSGFGPPRQVDDLPCIGYE